MDPQSAKEIFTGCAVGAAATWAILTFHRYTRRRHVSLLKTWATENHFELLSFHERGLFEAAPFFVLTSHHRPQFFVAVRDQQGNQRSAWVRLGSWAEGTIGYGKYAVEVKWVAQTQDLCSTKA